MYVCVCKGITDKQIEQAAKSGFETYRCLRQQTGIGTQCGKCSVEARSFFSQNAPAPLEQSFG